MRMSAVKRALLETIDGLIDMMPVEESLFAEQFFGKEMSLNHVRWMAETAKANVSSWPIDKTGRWIGFIQGVLACHQILDVSEERDRTRPLFHAAYAEDGEIIPETKEP